jgi:sulfur carrier protein ThiS
LRIRVELFGTLAKDFPGYDPLRGMDVNLPDDANVSDILAHLDIPETLGYIVIMDKHIVKSSDKIASGETIRIFLTIAGG